MSTDRDETAGDTGGTAPRGSAPGRAGRRAWLTVVAVAVLVAGSTGAVTAALVHRAIRSASTVVVGFSPNRSILPRVADVNSLLAKVLPAVVGVRTEQASGSSPNCASSGIAGGTEVDEGTGMILTSSGEVLTNNHVVAGGTSITVTLYGNGGSFPATIVGADPADDVALLQIHGASALPTIPLATGTPTVGEGVLAVGNALGLSLSSPTVTEGIISAEGRVVTAAVSCTNETLNDMFQTDAAINPGSSGGPLVDARGQVVGIDTAVAASSAHNAPAQNVGFAIPISDALALLSGLRRGGTTGPPKAFIGVEVQPVTPQLRQEFGYTPTYGAVVDSVVAGSPASAAGIQPGDVIVAFGAEKVTSAVVLSIAVGAARPAERVTIRYYRGRSLRSAVVVLAAAPPPA